ncbi:MAG: hypothetical protein SCARUB_05065 [Candidatus Scalindua rubra]|uniref:SxtJ n=1 Tax=Candidatus Scalindua rubra TaxID=1872076 RepID=A0A1E3X2A6_9BACT|nr:MAG: hypothetical protein SCARUB_05065 [Candidatus Scalindua rubra]
MNWIKEIFQEIKTLDTSKKAIRKFGLVIVVGLGVIGIFISLKTDNLIVSKWLWGIGLLFLILGFILPSILRPVYRLWMLLAYFIGGIVSRVILTVLFYFVLTPTGLVLRLFRKDLLNQKSCENCDSYWVKKDLSAHTKEQYKKMY